MKKKDLKIRFTKGKGPGGQNKNKVETACHITHISTGVTSYADERTRKMSKKIAMKNLKKKLKEFHDNILAEKKKQRRDDLIKNTRTIRTYDFKKGIVTDHRTGKRASLKDVLRKGKIDLLHSSLPVAVNL